VVVYACYHMFNECVQHFASLLLISGTLCTRTSISSSDLAKYSFLLVVTVRTEFDRSISAVCTVYADGVHLLDT